MARPKPHRLRTYLVIFGIALLVVIGGLAAFLHTSPARQYAREQVSRLLQQQNIEFSTDELSYNLFSLRLTLRNVRIRSQVAPALPPFASIDRVTLDLSLRSLLQRRYVLQAGDASGIAIHYLVVADGQDNLPRPPRDPDQPSQPLDYLIEDLRVSNAVIRYENQPQRIDVMLPVSTLAVEGDAMADRHTVTLEAANGRLRFQERTADVARLVGTVEWYDDEARFERMELDAGGTRATLTGTITQFADPQADLVVQSSIDAARVSTLAGLTEPLGGTILLDATVRGPIVAPALSGRIEGRAVSFRHLTGLDVTTTATYDIAARRATFSDLQLRAPFGQISGRGTLALGGTEMSRITATASQIDTAQLMRALALPYIVASRADAEVEAQWPALDVLEASGTAAVALTPGATRPSRSVIPVGGRVEVTGRAGAIDAVLRGVTAAGAEISGRVRVSAQRALSGETRVRVADVARTVSSTEAILGRGALLPTSASGRIEATVRLGGTVQSPAIAAQLQAPALTLGTASGLALNARLDYTPAAIRVGDLALNWRQARARAAGTVGLTGARALDLTFDAEALEVRELMRAANLTARPVSGTLAVDGRISGTASQPTATLGVRGSDLVAYHEIWGSLTARVNLAGRQVQLADLAIEKPQPAGMGRITAAGTYHLDRRTYALDFRTQNVELVSLALPNGRQVRGTLQARARGAGSIDQPAGTLNLVAESLQIDDVQVGRLVADALVQRGQATLTATAPAYALAADAVIGTTSPYTTTATLHVDNLQLATLPLKLQTPLEGQLRATLEAAGNLDAPAHMRAHAVIDAFAGSWNEQPFRIEAPARLRYANERLFIDHLRVVAQDSTLDVRGELPVRDGGPEGSIALEARAQLTTLSRYAPAGMNLSGAGQLTLAGTIRGTLGAIAPDLTLAIDNGRLVTPQVAPGLSNLNLRVRVANGEATIEQLAANWGTATLNAAGRIPLEVLPPLPVDVERRGGPAMLTARLEGLDIRQVPGAPEGLTGRVSLDAQIAADRADLMAVEGQVTFPHLQVALNGLTLAQRQPSTIRLAGGVATVERVTLAGSVGTITAGGTVGLTGERPLNVEATGHLNVAALSAFTDTVRAEGETTLNIAARGTLASPDLTGVVAMRDAQFAVDEPTIAAEQVNARLVLAGRRISIAELTGSLNGGTLTGAGHVELGAGGIADAALEVATNDVAFDAPLDLRSLSDAKLRVRRRADEYVLEGQVTLEEAGLTGDINVDEGLLAALAQRRTLDLTEQRHPWLERLRFDVDIDTATPVLVDNNLARAELTADLRLLGTLYEPGLAGRLTILDESEITLNERRYEVERGIITFLGERRIQPSFDLLLNTAARNYDITVAVTGTPGDTDTSLTASPTLPEPDIMALLATGRTLEEMRGEEFEIAREQVLSYLAGRVGSPLGRGLRDATGFDTVRIEPHLIANEADPSARLTLGEDIADNLELVYSVDLTDSSDQIWLAEYDVTRRFQTSAVRQRDNSYRVDFRHDVRFGGTPAPPRIRRERPFVNSLTITSDGTIPDAELRDRLEADEGEEYNFFAARHGVQKIEETLEERGYLQSRVRLRREGDAGAVDVALTVTAGPQVSLVFDGTPPPSRVVDAIRTKWRRGVFDTQRLDDSVEVLRGWLMDEHYLQPEVEAGVEELGPRERRVRFRIEPGVRFTQVILAFEGARSIAPATLDDLINEQDLERALFTDPMQVTELLERYYREQGFLVAAIDEPRFEFHAQQARVVLDVREGPRFVVRQVTVTGAAAIPSTHIAATLPVQAGDPFLPFAAENALEAIRDLYWQRGYNDARTDYELALDRQTGDVDVRFDVVEGAESVIAEITVQGNAETSERLVREQLELQTSEPLDLSALARSRRNLYDTQAFSIADIRREELVADSSPAGSEAGPAAPPGQKPIRLTVSVREVQPYQLRYGASYDTERGVGGVLDLSNHNSLGKARVIGLSARYDVQLTDLRAYISQPSLRYWPIQTIASIYYTDGRNPDTDLTRRFDIDRRGASINQERELGDHYLWNWGFRYERARSFDPADGGTLDELLTVTPLSSTLTRETRDDVLDATRGAFLSHALSYSPTWLGADRAYIKYFGQYFHYFALQRERRERFTNEMLRPRVVYAVGLRGGLARTFGNGLPISERFFAGGSNTLRGFEQNALGPIGADGLPSGGAAMLVLNNELRFPLIKILDGVVFSDVGNVFPRVSDITFTDVRETAGLGLRVRTPWFLVRGDYGILLDRRPGERRGRFYFSLGQAF